MQSQTKQILEYLEQGNSITPLDALNKFGCMRLGARIFNIKQLGHNIKSKLVTNGRKKWSEYWIEDKIEETPLKRQTNFQGILCKR